MLNDLISLMDSTLAAAIIGIIGIALGIILSEYFRRKSRIEKFAEAFFSKKVDIYEKLFECFLDQTNLFYLLIESEEKSVEEKIQIWQHSTLEYLTFLDKKYLFISEELTIHLSLTLISAGKFIEGEAEFTHNEILAKFGEAKLLIKKSLGLHYIESDFKRTSKSKITSGYIRYFNHVKQRS